MATVAQLMVKISADTKQAVHDVQSFAHSAISSLTSFQGLIAGSAAAAVVKFGLDFNAGMENAQIGFTTLLHSGTKAKAFLLDLQKFAATTPFEFPELRDAASRMLAYGFSAKQVIPILTSVGNAAAATGRGQVAINNILLSLGQMKAVGRASWEELKQISEYGVPALKYVAEAMGVTQAQAMKMLSKGLIPADKAIQAIKKGMDKDFGGMMKNMSTTFTGMVSNIKDSVGFLVGKAFKPTFDWIKLKILPAILDLVNAASKGFDTGGFSGALKAMVPKDIATRFDQVAKFIDNIKKMASSGDWKGIGEALGNAVGKAIGDIAKKISNLLSTATSNIDWYNIGVSIGRTAIPMILGFADGLLNHLDDLIPVFKAHWEGILLTLIGIITLPESWIAKLGAGLSKIPFVGTMLSKFTGWLNSLGGPIRNMFKRLFNGVGTSISTSFRAAIKGDGIIATLTRPFINGGKAVVKWIGDMITKGNTKLNSFGSLLGGTMGRAWNAARTAVSSGIKRVYDLVAGFVSKLRALKDKIVGVFSRMKISIPKFKLPHVNVSLGSKNIGGVNIPYPKIGVSWYAKGGIFNGPSVIGVGEQPGVKEAVVPLSGQNMKPFARAIADMMPNNQATNITNNINVYPQKAMIKSRDLMRELDRARWLNGGRMA